MASIAYVTDRKMIDFHRINGNHSINFWRLSSSKRFSSFHSGDYLFFLAKQTTKEKNKEKGIVGYGKFISSKSMSLNQMWNQYEVLNGYATKQELKEAISKVSKQHVVPKSMNCLLLSDVVFFQAPVYLSEIGIQISNSLESFIYLDKYGVEATTQILHKANEVGIDSWQFAMDSSLKEDVFSQDLIQHTIAKQIYQFFDPQKKQPKVFSRLLSENEELEFVKGGKQVLINRKTYELIFSLESTSKIKDPQVFELIGRIFALHRNLKDHHELKGLPIQYRILSDQLLPNLIVDSCSKMGIKVEITK